MAEHKDTAAARKEVWKITAYLSIITIVELALGYIMFRLDWQDGTFIKTFTKIVILLLMLWKAFYIIAYFMHLRYENLAFIRTIAIPTMLLIWAIIAFIWDGTSYKNLRARYTPYHVEHFSQPMEKVPAHGEETHADVPADSVQQSMPQPGDLTN